MGKSLIGRMLDARSRSIVRGMDGKAELRSRKLEMAYGRLKTGFGTIVDRRNIQSWMFHLGRPSLEQG